MSFDEDEPSDEDDPLDEDEPLDEDDELPDPPDDDADDNSFAERSVEPPSFLASLVDAADPSLAAPSPELDVSDDDPSSLDPDAARVLEREADRSFFAQPVPLK